MQRIDIFKWTISSWPNLRFSEKHIIRNKYESFLKILARNGADYFRIQREKCLSAGGEMSGISTGADSPIIRGIWHTRNDAIRAYVHEKIVAGNVRWRARRYPGSTMKYIVRKFDSR